MIDPAKLDESIRKMDEINRWVEWAGKKLAAQSAALDEAERALEKISTEGGPDFCADDMADCANKALEAIQVARGK